MSKTPKDCTCPEEENLVTFGCPIHDPGTKVTLTTKDGVTKVSAEFSLAPSEENLRAKQREIIISAIWDCCDSECDGYPHQDEVDKVVDRLTEVAKEWGKQEVKRYVLSQIVVEKDPFGSGYTAGRKDGVNEYGGRTAGEAKEAAIKAELKELE